MPLEQQLLRAAERGDIMTAHDLLQRDVDFDTQAHDHTGSNPFQAVFNRNHNAARFLVGLGADPSARGIFDLSPLELAVATRKFRRQIRAFRTLLAPDIIEAIMNGKEPSGISIAKLTRRKLPVSWQEQRTYFGF